MGLAKWQNITQPSGSKFDFLLWEFLFGCLVDEMHAFITGDIFFSFFDFCRIVVKALLITHYKNFSDYMVRII